MDVGKILQDARIAKNLSLDTVAQETNIRKAYLEAIEQNDFASLHGDVFVKGVMRTYGNYLGLNGSQLVEEYKAASSGTVSVKDNNAIRESRHVKVRPTFKSDRDIGSGSGNDHRLLFIVAGFLFLVIVAAGGFYFYLDKTGQEINSLLPFRFEIGNKAKEQDKKDTGQPENKVPLLQETKTKESLNDEKAGKDATKPSEKAKEKDKSSETDSKNSSVKEVTERETGTSDINTASGSGSTVLKVASTGKCWLRVTDQNGTVLFQGNLLKGESKSFSSRSNIIMRIGNLKDLQIEHNGTILPFEETKEAVTRIYTPKEAQ